MPPPLPPLVLVADQLLADIDDMLADLNSHLDAVADLGIVYVIRST